LIRFGGHQTIKSPLPCGKWINFVDPFLGGIKQNQVIDLAVNGLFYFRNILASELAD
jgi:hypothetical protein